MVVTFPPALRAWVGRELGPGGRVVRATAIPGGLVSTVHRVTVETPTRRCHVAVKHISAGSVVSPAEAEDLIRREAAALRRLDGRARAPRLVAADAEGREAGAPAIVQELLPGTPTVAPPRPDRFVAAVVQYLEDRWSEPVRTAGLGSFAWWHGDGPDIPSWAPDPAVWREAFDVLAAFGAGPRGDGVLHRDLHPGNLLWRRGRLTGVVDWCHLCRGPEEADLARLLVETDLVAPELGRRLRDAIAAARGGPGDPRWALGTALELAPHASSLVGFTGIGADVTVAQIRRRLDRLVRRSLG